MEGQTKILWDFLNAAYRTGALDEALSLVKIATGKDKEDQAHLFAGLEDAITELDDFSGVDQTLEEVYRQMSLLMDEEIFEGLAAFLSLIAPLVDSVMKSADRDSELLIHKRDQLIQDLPKMAKALFAIIALNSGAIVSALGGKSASQYGQNLGNALNAMASFINGVNERDPEAVSDFMSGAFSTVDRDAVAKMADTLTQAFLDQRPPIFKWTAQTMAKRAKKRVLKK
jgi:hypothetical protein